MNGPAGVSSAPSPMGLPGSLVAVAVLLFVLGVLSALGAVVLLLVSAIAATAPDELGLPVGPGSTFLVIVFLLVLGAVLAVAGVAHVVVGVGVLRRRSWGRVGGLVLGVLGIVLTPLTAVYGLQPAPEGDPFTGVPYEPTALDVGVTAALAALTLAAYALVTLILWRRGASFA